ncbi:redoxin domain-containing protein [bacterium]|nr:redoxin domain-containing protein [FCB group bacterium]MBL7190732.1 redoxin domain-containing protein [bacterium]
MKSLLISIIIIITAAQYCLSAGEIFDQAISIEDIDQRIEFIESKIFTGLETEAFDALSRQLLKDYEEQSKFNKIAIFLDKYLENSGGNSSILNQIGWSLAEANKYLDFAVRAAKTAVQKTREISIEEKPADLSPAAWRQRIDWRLSSYLDTYGWALYQSGKYEEAEKALSESAALDADNSETKLHLARAKMKLNRHQEAFLLALEAEIIDDSGDADIVARQAFIGWKRTMAGFDNLKSEMQEEMRQVRRDNLIRTKINQPAPNFSLKDIKGNTVSLADFRGQIVFLDFWATWCPPCLKELPVFQKTHEKYQNQGVKFLAVSTDKDTSKVIPFLLENGYNFTALYDEGAKTAYDVAGIPTVFIIDGAGNIQYKHVGYHEDIAEIWEAQIAELKK